MLSAFKDIPEKSIIKYYHPIDESTLPPMQYKHLPVYDTIFVLSDEYIEISLREQLAHLFRRNDSTMIYKISTGTDKISKGLNTPEGIFTVQSKSPMAVSKQFNNANLHNWIGFNMNIGFHGLDGSGYYNSLGKRPTSHGCVRIGKDDGKCLYDKVRLGTPVLVYEVKPARILKFADWDYFNEGRDYLLTDAGIATRKMMNERLEMFYKGMANALLQSKLFISGRDVIKPGGFSQGNASKIAKRQRIFPLLRPVPPERIDRLHIDKYFDLVEMKSNADSSTDSSSRQ